jgi:DNA-binding SARP family transcriptional activator/Flp pilus assembly protein TadD
MEFRILGPVEVWRDGRPVDVGHPRQRAVLAVLVLDAGRVVPLEALIDRVWGEDSPPSVRNVVYGYVGRLKALLADGIDPAVSLSRRRGGYLLQAEPGRVDVARFRRLVADAAAAEGDERAETLGEALALWRGPALSGVDSRWLNGMRARLELERTTAALDLGDIRLRRGEHRAMAGELARRAAAAPADERLTSQLMLALYRCGRQAEALHWFEQTRVHLADELGADPSPDLQALHQQILRADPALAAPGPASRPAAPTPRELPADVTAFTGRAAELARLDRLLAAAPAAGTGAGASPGPEDGAGDRRVTAAVISAVSGTAGVGKTALAIHWAHQAVERFPDGQLYVNLRGYDPDRPVTAADALAGFLRALGVPGQDIPPGEDERAARYRSLVAGKRMLVVLDNAGSVELLRPLLPGTAACAVVVTSRDALAGLVARDGAARLDLSLLPLAEAVALLTQLIGERARADPDAAAELARQCARLPLALRVAAELAAARPGAPLAALVAELADQQKRLDLLDADGDPRTAVRGVFSWSCRNLDADAARTFRMASLHPGPDFDPYAVAALAGTTAGQARRMLGLLARAHLIQTTGPGRYGMHDLLRAYARELAAGHDGEAGQRTALTRLFDHYLHGAAAAMDTLHPAERHRRPRIIRPATPVPPVSDHAGSLAWLEAELASLVAVAVYTAEHDWPTHATRLATTLFRHLDNSGHYQEAVAVHSHARQAAHRTGDHAAEAEALICLGAADWRQGRYQQAAQRHRQSLALYRDINDQPGQARALGNIALVDHEQGRYQDAADHHRQALALFRKIGDRTGEARTLNSLADIDKYQGRYEQAQAHFRKAQSLFQKAGDRNGQARSLANLADIYLRLGRYEQSSTHLQQALAIFREAGSRSAEAPTLTDLGVIDMRLGRYQQAASHHRQALAIFRENGNLTGEAEVLNRLGDSLLGYGQHDDARGQHTAALRLATQIGNKYLEARAYEGLGHACDATDDGEQARRYWLEALGLYTELGVPEADQVRARLRGKED